MNRVLGGELESGERLLITQVLVSMHEEGVDTALAEGHLSQAVAARIHTINKRTVKQLRQGNTFAPEHAVIHVIKVSIGINTS